MTRSVTPLASLLRHPLRLEPAWLLAFRVLRHLPRMHMCAGVRMCDAPCRNGETHVTTRVCGVTGA